VALIAIEVQLGRFYVVRDGVASENGSGFDGDRSAVGMLFKSFALFAIGLLLKAVADGEDSVDRALGKSRRHEVDK
jgi:hypothetical protein